MRCERTPKCGEKGLAFRMQRDLSREYTSNLIAICSGCGEMYKIEMKDSVEVWSGKRFVPYSRA
jgi:hypothetical protein